MRRRDERAHAAVRRDLGHGNAPREVVGSVVDAGQHVRVQVDHGADIGEVEPVTRARLAAALPFVPAYIVVATWVAWATHDGGYFAVQRYPGALLAAALLLVLAIARPPGTLRRSPALLPLGLLAAWTAWNGLSLAWSSAPDHGWESTNALLTVVVMGFVLSLTPWRATRSWSCSGCGRVRSP